MLLAVLADIHGNLPALNASLEAARRAGVDGYLVAGDLVGYGPFPNECVETVATLHPYGVVAGNHDLMALGRLGTDRCIPLARRSIEWTRGALRPDVREYLEKLPLRSEVVPGVVVAHGSLDDPQEYTVGTAAALAQLSQLEREHPAARVLVLGHTHRPLLCTPSGGAIAPRRPRAISLGSTQALVNPGGVGQSRELRLHARFALLDLDRREAAYHTVGYDPTAFRVEARRQRLDPRAYHLRPSPLRASRRAARRLVTPRSWWHS